MLQKLIISLSIAISLSVTAKTKIIDQDLIRQPQPIITSDQPPEIVSGIYSTIIKGIPSIGANYYRYELEVDLVDKEYTMRVEELQNPTAGALSQKVYKGQLNLLDNEIQLLGNVEPNNFLILKDELLAAFNLKLQENRSATLGIHRLAKMRSIYPKGFSIQKIDQQYQARLAAEEDQKRKEKEKQKKQEEIKKNPPKPTFNLVSEE